MYGIIWKVAESLTSYNELINEMCEIWGSQGVTRKSPTIFGG